MGKKILLIILFLLIIAIPVLAVEIDNPIGTKDPQQLAGMIIKAVLGLVGIIALLYFILGGFQWMTAAGNLDKVKKGRDTLIWATLGILIIFASYSLVNYFFEQVKITT
ncbi:MAG: hypothetical protein AUJ28_01945 [Parcubacteria group bacterium CG1_02_37_51]|uniref:Uncharacterized protein n=1 Tax=Candidatus Komeilibacteria bacterium CG_4_10_14_0_8_um_filter_37_78 TaxID=1974471 RepID=A0A2M7RBR1_9BACT|nr:MAG: hypothetical protein AUJ28_01945 [Parcubacteria group bacterium CG1_02_37_51]PIY94205.1 MAG: hypothetical protein COY67_03000 [Candidatus Komeilibacteria bacterium CG_4_10_14_0_8_um_filter_37_78]